MCNIYMYIYIYINVQPLRHYRKGPRDLIMRHLVQDSSSVDCIGKVYDYQVPGHVGGGLG